MATRAEIYKSVCALSGIPAGEDYASGDDSASIYFRDTFDIIANSISAATRWRHAKAYAQLNQDSDTQHARPPWQYAWHKPEDMLRDNEFRLVNGNRIGGVEGSGWELSEIDQSGYSLAFWDYDQGAFHVYTNEQPVFMFYYRNVPVEDWGERLTHYFTVSMAHALAESLSGLGNKQQMLGRMKDQLYAEIMNSDALVTKRPISMHPYRDAYGRGQQLAGRGQIFRW